MVLWNHLDGGPSHSGPLLGPSESEKPSGQYFSLIVMSH
jgi:hypothetical protein